MCGNGTVPWHEGATVPRNVLIVEASATTLIGQCYQANYKRLDTVLMSPSKVAKAERISAAQ